MLEILTVTLVISMYLDMGLLYRGKGGAGGWSVYISNCICKYICFTFVYDRH